MIFDFHEVEKFGCRTLRYFMFIKCKSLTEELYEISVHEVEMLTGELVRYFMSTKWKSLTGELYDIFCPRSGSVQLENATKYFFRKVENV